MIIKLQNYYKKSLSNFAEAVINLFIFLPYFFSVANLVKTLFYPWKRLESKKQLTGFSLSEWLGRVSFNLISRIIGFSMRVSIILFYFLAQSVLLILLPLAFFIYLIIVPILFVESLFQPSDEQKKETSRLKFIGTHLLHQENYAHVAEWFENYYDQFLRKSEWWKKSNLFSLPPLARDWATGFTPVLDQYSEELTSFAYLNSRKNIVNRLKELAEIERVFSKSREANILIVGEEGVGKHTIVDALAKKLFEGKINPLLMYKRVLKLNMEKILNEFTDQKKRERFFEVLLQEAAEANNLIICIDEFEKYVSIGPSSVDLTTSIEKFAKSDKVHFLGLTAPFLYQKMVYPNERLRRLFEKIEVKEVNTLEAEKILKQAVFIFEERYSFFIPYETVKEVIEKSDFYITAIPFPEKALDLLDSACVRAKQIDIPKKIVLPEIVDAVLSEKTHVPVALTNVMKEKLIHLEALLKLQIVQQNEAIDKLSSTLRRSFTLMDKRKKPLATFLFLGPTGVGKTETAKAIAKIFFGSDSYLLRFDMSNFQSINDIPNLIGSTQSGNPGHLVKAIRETPYGVLLLDEIEKADKNLINIFLTILDEGYFTDGFGNRVDCKNLVIIATSNAGSDLIYQKSNKVSQTDLINYLIEKKIFTPELLNRFDGVIAYNALGVDAVRQISENMIRHIASEIGKSHRVNIEVSDKLSSEIVTQGSSHTQFGARNLERLIRDLIEDKIAKLILEGKAREGSTVKLT